MNRALKALRGVVAAGAVAALVQGIGAVASSPLADANNGPMIATTAVNIRPNPNASGARLGVLYPGERITAVGSSNGWTEVTYRGRTAYVSSAYLRSAGGSTSGSSSGGSSSGGSSSGSTSGNSGSTTAGTATVTASALNLRTGPGTNHARSVVVARGTKLTLTGTVQNGFAQVNRNGRTLWASQQYLSTSSSAATPPPASGGNSGGNQSGGGETGATYTSANLNLRTGPSTSNPSRKVVPRGTKLSLTGTVSGGWAQVTHNGQTLWASQQYLSGSAPAASLPAVTGQGRARVALLIRTTSGSNYSTVETVPAGTILDATGVVTNGMAQVIHKGNVRWVNNQYFDAVGGDSSPSQPSLPSTSTRYATANLNIWTGATGDARVGLINKGSAIEVTGTVQSGRAQIVHNGVIRWVTAQYTATSAPSANPAPGSGGSSESLNRGHSSGLDQTNANVQKIVRHVWGTWSEIKTMYGWRRDVTPDHPAGRAVDIMIPSWSSSSGNDLGWKIANYYRANAAEFRVHYIIFDQKIWNINRDREGWRDMADRGNSTANHLDHVHITTFDN